MTFTVEYTDTLGGEANYGWVRRAVITVADPEPDTVYTSAATVARKHRAYERELMRKAKAAVGLTGVRGRRSDYSDTVEFRPYGSATVMFVTPA
jgi:hypothetical protein